MIPTRQAVRILGRFAENAKAYTTYKAYIHDFPMTEARGAEVDVDSRWEDKMFPGSLVWKEGHHEVLEEAAGFGKGHVDPLCGVGGLLEEDGVAGEFADVDGDVEALAGEDAVHYGDILMGGAGGAADGDDEDAGLEACAGFPCGCTAGGGFGGRGWVGGGGVEVGGAAVGFGIGDCFSVDVAWGEGEGACHHG